MPITAISMRASLINNPEVPIVVRGGGTSKYSFQTSSKAAKSLRSMRKTCAFVTFSSELPAAGKVALEILEDVSNYVLADRAVK